MRILTISYEYPPIGGGGAKVAAGIATKLVSLGHGVDVVTMGYRGLSKEEEMDGVRVHRVSSIRRSAVICRVHEMVWYLIFAVPFAMRLVRRERYSINHTHFIFPDAVLSFVLKRWAGLSYVVTAHGSDVPGYNPDRFVTLHSMLRFAWRPVVSSAATVVCPSEYLQTLLRRQLPSSSTKVIPNGFQCSRFDPDRPKRRAILAVARMLRRKGIQHLLRALDEAGLDFDVDIVGDGPYLAELKALAEELGVTANFTGWLPNDSTELQQLYESASIFVCLSDAENFPVVLLEAMAAGLAIVTSDATGCREVVGDAAVLVPPGDHVALRKVLRSLVADDELVQKLGRAARARLESHFSWDIVSQKYLATLEENVRCDVSPK